MEQLCPQTHLQAQDPSVLAPVLPQLLLLLPPSRMLRRTLPPTLPRPQWPHSIYPKIPTTTARPIPDKPPDLPHTRAFRNSHHPRGHPPRHPNSTLICPSLPLAPSLNSPRLPAVQRSRRRARRRMISDHVIFLLSPILLLKPLLRLLRLTLSPAPPLRPPQPPCLNISRLERHLAPRLVRRLLLQIHLPLWYRLLVCLLDENPDPHPTNPHPRSRPCSHRTRSPTCTWLTRTPLCLVRPTR